MEVLKKYISPHQLDNYLLGVCGFRTQSSSCLVQGWFRPRDQLCCWSVLRHWWLEQTRGDSLSESVSASSPCFLLYLNLIMTTSYASFQGFLGHTHFRQVWFWDRQRTGNKCMCVWELLFFPNLISSFLSAVIRAAWQGLNLSFWCFHVLQQHN